VIGDDRRAFFLPSLHNRQMPQLVTQAPGFKPVAAPGVVTWRAAEVDAADDFVTRSKPYILMPVSRVDTCRVRQPTGRSL